MPASSQAVTIHPTAIVSEGAQIGAGSVIGAYSIIGPKVVIGAGSKIGPHVVIEGNTRIGDDNIIFQFASIGSAPQDLKYQGEDSLLEIGDRNKIREYVTLQPGTKGGGMRTSIGSDNLFMANSHVGHDSRIGNGNVLANSSAIAGHVEIGSGVTLGGLTGVHQFVRLGDLSILGAGSMVNKDVPPFCIAQGDRAHLFGINKVALERKGFSADDIARLRQLYRSIFIAPGTMKEKLQGAAQACGGFKLGLQLLEFLSRSERGFTMPKKSEDHE